MSPTLETPRLRLRPLTPSDEADLVALDSDPEVMRYITYGVPTPRATYQDVILPRWFAIYEATPLLGYWAAEDRASGEFLGWFHLQASIGPKGAPHMKKFLGDSPQQLHLRVHLLAVAFLVAAAWWPMPLVYVAAVALAASALVQLRNLAGAARFYRGSLRQPSVVQGALGLAALRGEEGEPGPGDRRAGRKRDGREFRDVQRRRGGAGHP